MVTGEIGMYTADVISYAGWIWLIGIALMIIIKGYRQFDDTKWYWYADHSVLEENLFIFGWPIILIVSICIVFPYLLLTGLGSWIAAFVYHIRELRWIGRSAPAIYAEDATKAEREDAS